MQGFGMFSCFRFFHFYDKSITPPCTVSSYLSLITLKFKKASGRSAGTNGMRNAWSWLTARSQRKMISCNVKITSYCFAPNSSNEIKKRQTYHKTLWICMVAPFKKLIYSNWTGCMVALFKKLPNVHMKRSHFASDTSYTISFVDLFYQLNLINLLDR